MLTLCSALLGVKARSAAGVMLADVLNERKAENAGLTNAHALLARLTELGRTDETARELAGLMNLYADTEYGAVLFDNDLPPLNLASRGIVFLTHGVALPTKEEIDNAAMFDQLGLDKLFGHAMYALLTRIAREICFRDSNELAVFAADELAHVTASPRGSQRSPGSSATGASTAPRSSWRLRMPATSATRSPAHSSRTGS